MHAEICPICKGQGTVPLYPQGGYTVEPPQPCHGCGGKGWVEVTG
jgi:DnaJ-class molecular chaperone